MIISYIYITLFTYIDITLFKPGFGMTTLVRQFNIYVRIN